MYKGNERMNLANHCGFISIYLGLYYNERNILKNYQIYSISDLYDMLVEGSNNYKSLFDRFNYDKLNSNNL
jgi:hypothetical protein